MHAEANAHARARRLCLNSKAEQIRITWNLGHADAFQHDVLKPVFSSYRKVLVLAHFCALEENR